MSDLKEIIEVKVNDLISDWHGVKAQSSEFQKNAIDFLINSLDQLVNYAESNVVANGDKKKQLVLDGLSSIYDATGSSFLPIYLRPFSVVIKRFLLSVVFSYLIDFVVSKYRDGSWSKKEVPVTPVIPTGV